MIWIVKTLYVFNLLMMSLMDIKERKVNIYNLFAEVILSIYLYINLDGGFYKFCLIGISGFLLSVFLKNFVGNADMIILFSNSLLIKTVYFPIYLSVALLLGSLVCLIIIICFNRSKQMPFIPFLTLGFLFVNIEGGCMKSNNEKGSSSIEAAVIMTTFFLIISSVIYLSFYLRDRVVIKSVCVKRCEEYMLRDDKKNVLSVIKNDLSGDLYVIKNVNVSGKVKGTINVKVTGKYEGFAERMMDLFTGGNYSFSYKTMGSVDKEDVYKINGVKKVLTDISEKR